MKTTSKPRVVILHGWGASSKHFQELAALFEKQGFSVEVPDLPGFGGSPLTKDPMTFGDYVSFVEKALGKRKVILIGHSFGGRIAVVFTAKHPGHVAKLILTGASGIVHPLLLKQKLVFALAKIGKALGFSFLRKPLYFFLGEWDYYQSGPLAQTFQQVYRVSIEDDLPKISVPTLLVWGEKDTATSLRDGELMHRKIQGSTLVIVNGATHKLPYEMPHVFVENILPFLKQ